MSPSTAPLTETAWRPVLEGQNVEEAVRLALDLADRLARPELVQTAVRESRERSREPQYIHWQPYSIAQGEAGLAMLYACLEACFPDQGWDRVAHRYVVRASREAELEAGPPLGMFSGISGLAFAVLSLSRGGSRYGRLLESLDTYLMAGLEAALARLGSKGRFPVREWDLISGLTGSGIYLLSRFPSCEAAMEQLEPLLKFLVALCQEEDGAPRYYTPGRLIANPDVRAENPGGQLNLGLSHGIPGILGLLSLARATVEVPGHKQAILGLIETLQAHRADDSWGCNWPSAVGSQERAPSPTHAAWCYGSPGIARSLWLAGDSLGCVSVKQAAIEAAIALCHRPPESRRLASPTFCHGTAGLLHILMRFYNDTGMELTRATAHGLALELMSAYAPDTLLGYQTTDGDGTALDQPGLLDGSPGVAMVLLAAAVPEPPTWDRIFLLS